MQKFHTWIKKEKPRQTKEEVTVKAEAKACLSLRSITHLMSSGELETMQRRELKTKQNNYDQYSQIAQRGITLRK